MDANWSSSRSAPSPPCAGACHFTPTTPTTVRLPSRPLGFGHGHASAPLRDRRRRASGATPVARPHGVRQASRRAQPPAPGGGEHRRGCRLPRSPSQRAAAPDRSNCPKEERSSCEPDITGRGTGRNASQFTTCPSMSTSSGTVTRSCSCTADRAPTCGPWVPSGWPTSSPWSSMTTGATGARPGLPRRR